MVRSRRTFAISVVLINIWILTLVQPSIQADDPLYYGFFFDEKIAASITKASVAYLKSVNSNISEVEEFLKEISQTDDPLKYYEKPKDPLTQKDDPFYHVTAKYCGDTGKEECAQYAKTFEQFLNKKFQMELVGFVFTNRTFGIRIKLVDDQCQLLQNMTCPESKSAEASSPQLPGLKLDPVEDWGTLPITATQAHITLGCAPGVPAVTTGPDMLLAIEFEQEVADGGTDEESMTWYDAEDPFVAAENKTMSVTGYNFTAQTTDKVFVIYPRVRIVAEATFKAFPHSGGSSVLSVISGSGGATLSLLFLFSQLYLHKYF